MKDEITKDWPDILTDIIKKAVLIDNRLQERKKERSKLNNYRDGLKKNLYRISRARKKGKGKG